MAPLNTIRRSISSPAQRDEKSQLCFVPCPLYDERPPWTSSQVASLFKQQPISVHSKQSTPPSRPRLSSTPVEEMDRMERSARMRVWEQFRIWHDWHVQHCTETLYVLARIPTFALETSTGIKPTSMNSPMPQDMSLIPVLMKIAPFSHDPMVRSLASKQELDPRMLFKMAQTYSWVTDRAHILNLVGQNHDFAKHEKVRETNLDFISQGSQHSMRLLIQNFLAAPYFVVENGETSWEIPHKEP